MTVALKLGTRDARQCNKWQVTSERPRITPEEREWPARITKDAFTNSKAPEKDNKKPLKKRHPNITGLSEEVLDSNWPGERVPGPCKVQKLTSKRGPCGWPSGRGVGKV